MLITLKNARKIILARAGAYLYQCRRCALGIVSQHGLSWFLGQGQGHRGQNINLNGRYVISVWGSISPLQASIGSTQGGVAMLVDNTITGLTLINSEFLIMFIYDNLIDTPLPFSSLLSFTPPFPLAPLPFISSSTLSSTSLSLFSFFPSHPGYFGKVGMRHFHLTHNKYHCPTVNLDKLWSLVSEQTRHNFKDRSDGKAPIIDVVRAVGSYAKYAVAVLTL